MNHDELKKQFEAEAAANPMAWKNWQWQQALTDNGWQPVGTGGPGWSQIINYRRNPSAPPFTAPKEPSYKQQAMDRVGEVDHCPLEDGIQPPAPKRHKYADLAIAAVEGVKQMQRADTDACFGMTHPATYKDCSSEVALELIMGGFGYQVRIKPSTRTVQYRPYSTKTGVSLWTSLQEFDQKTVESWTTHHGWLEPTRTVEVPV
jgi:hypothetical protein